MDTTNKGIARLAIAEARAARLGLGHWANVSPAIRKGNVRSELACAAEYRRRAQDEAAR